MKVIKGKLAGFCPGVKRAWEVVEKTAGEGPVFVLGDLIHNRQAIERLKALGVVTIYDLEKISPDCQVIIRAHGEPEKTYEELERLGAKIIDATCFRVRKIQQQAAELERNGYQVIVCGEKEHPEIKATLGHTKKGKVIESALEAEKLKIQGKVALISQTTFSSEEFKKIREVLRKKKGITLKVLGTICDFTQAAQKEARELGKKVDCLIVVGGRHSSNTKRLKEVGEKIRSTYHIETADELKPGWFKDKKIVGLLAGASTPSWIISQVERKLKEL